MLKRADRRALQWTEDDASEPIQSELIFPSDRGKHIIAVAFLRLIRITTAIIRLPKPPATIISAETTKNESSDSMGREAIETLIGRLEVWAPYSASS